MGISIVIPAYNAEETIENCLEAVMNARSSCGNCEVIVVDDGSTDDTARIAQHFPLQLISSSENEGRIRARERGALAAANDSILFVDSRVIVPPNTFEIIGDLDYEPIMGGTVTLNRSEGSLVERLLFLIRRRIYAPYYPQSDAYPIIWLTAENFDRVPKGLTFLLVDRARFLRAIPSDRSRYVNDDTRLLARIVSEKPISIPGELKITHLPRKSLISACRHVFERGPRFADYHLRPGRKYFLVWIVCLVLILTSMATIAIAPKAIIWSGIGAVTLLMGISLMLAMRPSDVLVVTTVLPFFALCFGAGIVRGMLCQALKADRRAWMKRIMLIITLGALVGYFILSKDKVTELSDIRWQYLPLLAAIHLGFLASNGLILKTAVKTFDVDLRRHEWFGLAAITAMASYLTSTAGGMVLRGGILKRKFSLSIASFVALQSAVYVVNASLASALGLCLYAAHVSWSTPGEANPVIPLFLATVGLATVCGLYLLPSLGISRWTKLAFLERVRHGLALLRADRVTTSRIAILLTINFALNALMLVIGFASLSFPLDPMAAMLLSVLSSFAIFVSLTPANIGIQETLTAFSAHLIGYGFDEALAVAMICRFVSLVNAFMFGPIFAYRLSQGK